MIIPFNLFVSEVIVQSIVAIKTQIFEMYLKAAFTKTTMAYHVKASKTKSWKEWTSDSHSHESKNLFSFCDAN